MKENGAAVRSNSKLKGRLAELEQAHLVANPKSFAMHEEAVRSMPGGNTRAVLHYSPFPLTFASGKGCWLKDLDGHQYIDFLGEFSAGLYGHSDPVIAEAIRTALDEGIVLGGPNRYEGALAAEICRRFASIDLVRFTNSGTEANLLALAAARVATGRQSVMVMEGGYHGGVLYFGQHKSEINVAGPWVFGRYNDLETTLATIEREKDALAAVLIEPMMGAGGGICAQPEFLQALRDACDRFGIVLIFDEVMTSRMGPGGMQGEIGVVPHMTTLGKYLGGGLSFGAFGGRRDLMARFDPRRSDAVSHAGTFNNNVLSMSAGLAGLTQVLTVEAQTALSTRGGMLRRRMNQLAADNDVPVQILGAGSVLGVHFKKGPIRTPQDVWPADGLAAQVQSDLCALLHLSMLAEGCYFARRGYLALSLPISEVEIDRISVAFESILQRDGGLIRDLVQ